MSQKIEYINIKDLVLWTENPRDPINKDAVDQAIVNKAFQDPLGKWSLAKLAKEMGSYYDFSEIPTVVYHDKRPIVYDGNRRIILGKIKHGLAIDPTKSKVKIPEFPEKIPCNVCSESIAIKNIYRKHSDTGSWQSLERDIFVHKFMNKKKSIFLILDENTGIISLNPHLNQRFVKEEVFREDILKNMGFQFRDGKLYSKHSNKKAHAILSDVSRKIAEKIITTRKNRGKIVEKLMPSNQASIDKNKKNKFHLSKIKFKKLTSIIKDKRRTKRTYKKTDLFGGHLYLNPGNTSNFYRDIVDLYEFYITEKKRLSQMFPAIIRMSLRLLCETAAKDKRMVTGKYLIKYFNDAKKALNIDAKTTLANQNVTKKSIVQLLQTGAHSYESSTNLDQTIAISLIIGAILSITHEKDK